MAAKKTFTWTGINKKGQRLKGILEAPDANTVKSELKNRDIEVISLTRGKGAFFSVRRKKIKPKEILYFTRYLSTMLTAGVPILQAFDIISQEQKNEELKTVILSIRDNVASGKTLAESFRQFPQYFSALYCNLIQAGEKSGTLGKILKRLAEYLEGVEQLKSKVKKALIYPTVVIFVAITVTLVLLLFVVPQFQQIFGSAGAKLPAFTRAIISFSAFVRANFIYVVLIIALIIWLIRFSIRKNAKFAYRFDQLKLRIWVIGEILKKSMLARFSNTLSITLEAGLPIVESMKTMSSIMNNRVYKKSILQVRDELAQGHTLASAIQNTKLFPPMMIQMIIVGETAGSLPAMLSHVTHYYEEEVNNTVDNLSSIIEPIIILILGVVIGGFVVAMYLPIFKLGSLF